MPSPGQVVTLPGSAERWAVLDVDETAAPHGRMWRVVRKSADMPGSLRSRLVGEGSMTLVAEAPLWSPGTVLRSNGGRATVIADDGGRNVTILRSARLDERVRIRTSPQNSTVPRAYLVLDNLQSVVP